MLRPLALLALLATSALADPLDLASNQAYLAANAKKPGVITKPSGLEYRVLRSGSLGGRRPGSNDTVRLTFTGKTIDGKQFDGSAPGFPATLPFATVSVRGLAEALAMMREGDRWELVMPASLGFGTRGVPGLLAPNQTLVFDVTLSQVIPAAQAGGTQGPSLGFYSKEYGTSHEAGATLTIPSN